MPPPSAVDRLFADLANPHRRRYLARLARGPSTASALARASQLSVQEAMRHLARLVSIGLVERNAGRAYALTPLGALLAGRLADYDAFLEDVDFANAHDFSRIPRHLSLMPLVAAPRAAEGQPAHVRLVAEVVAAARQLRFAGDPALLAPLGWAPEEPPPGPRSWDVVVAYEHGLPSLRRPGGPEPPAEMRVRVLDELPLTLVLTEAEGLAFLRSAAPGGAVDYGTLVRTRSPLFLAWAAALFQHLVERSQPLVAPETRRPGLEVLPPHRPGPGEAAAPRGAGSGSGTGPGPGHQPQP